MSIEAMKQALDELEYVLECINQNRVPLDGDDYHETMRLLCQAIEQAEPSNSTNYVTESKTQKRTPQREWVGLTSDDVISLCKQFLQPRHSDLDAIYFTRAIEAKLKEKNYDS